MQYASLYPLRRDYASTGAEASGNWLVQLGDHNCRASDLSSLLERSTEYRALALLGKSGGAQRASNAAIILHFWKKTSVTVRYKPDQNFGFPPD